MILQIFIFGLALSACQVFSASIDCNIEQCAKPTKFYEELGCKAVFGSKSCCPKRFECPDFTKLDADKCTFEGKEYRVGETLPRNFTDDTKCVETCICARQGNDPAKFICTNSDCGVSSFEVAGCIKIYGDLNECCSTSIVCDNAERDLLASCFAGKEYREGEKFIHPSNPCYECLCHKDFDNTTVVDNPHCRKLNCEIDLRYKSFVQRGCLPIFQSDKCCPVDWECPKQNKKVVKRATTDGDDDSPKQDIYIVTPSKNLDGYLAEVKLSNEDDRSTEVFTTSTETATKELTQTEAATIPTLSSNPFVPPNDGLATTPISVKIEEHSTEPLKVLAELDEVTTTKAPTTHAESSPESSTAKATTTTEASTEKLVEKIPETTHATTQTSTAPVTTTITTTTKKIEDSSEESNESSEEDKSGEGMNLFGEKVTETVPSTTTTATTTTTSTTTTTTTAAPLTTVAESTAAPSTTEHSEVKAQEELLATSKPEPPAQLRAAISEADLNTHEVIASTTLKTEEPPTQAPVTEAPAKTEVNVLPTEFQKLLTTLRDFVAKAESLTSTAAPETTSAASPAELEQKLEFVNFTVSSELTHEDAKQITKRSAPAADLIPRYYKQLHSSNKEKGCSFNDKQFKVGEIITTDNECLKCICEFAPIGHCVLREKCNF